MISLLIHIKDSDPIKVDVEEMPSPSDQAIIGKNPRDKTDRDLLIFEDGVTTVLFPWWRITFVEVLPSPSDAAEFPLPFRND